jgi:hypothetical protein
MKFTDEGIVSISITCKKSKNHMDRIIASIRDTGTGIHPEILPKLFSMLPVVTWVRVWDYSFGRILWNDGTRTK